MCRWGRRRHTSRLAVDERGRGVSRHSRGCSWRVTSELMAASARRALRSTALIGIRALVGGLARSLAPRCVARGVVVTRRVSRWTSVAEVSVGTTAVRLACHVRVNSASFLPLQSTALIGARASGAKVGGPRYGTKGVRRRTRPHSVCVCSLRLPLVATPPFRLIGSRRVNKLWRSREARLVVRRPTSL